MHLQELILSIIQLSQLQQAIVFHTVFQVLLFRQFTIKEIKMTRIIIMYLQVVLIR
jgi:hypothetical protein